MIDDPEQGGSEAGAWAEAMAFLPSRIGAGQVAATFRPATDGFMAGRMAERADLLARLRTRRDNATAMARGDHDAEGLAARLLRWLAAEIEYVAAGLHEGAAAVREAMGKDREGEERHDAS